LNESWCALFIAIYYNITPEQAFETFWKGKVNRINRSLTKDDELEMTRLKQQGMTYKEIGDIYGISDHAVYKRIKYRRKGA
jgi:DNA invertase Pin-like site-specific DNA recombinase